MQTERQSLLNVTWAPRLLSGAGTRRPEHPKVWPRATLSLEGEVQPQRLQAPACISAQIKMEHCKLGGAVPVLYGDGAL